MAVCAGRSKHIKALNQRRSMVHAAVQVRERNVAQRSIFLRKIERGGTGQGSEGVLPNTPNEAPGFAGCLTPG
jgi:hypothetical protein